MQNGKSGWFYTIWRKKDTHQLMHNCPFMHNCYSAGAYMHWHCIICTGTVALPFNILMFPFIILMFYLYGIKSKYFTPFLSLLSLASRNTNASALSLFHSWASSHLLSLSDTCSLSSPPKIMWSVWGFCSPVGLCDGDLLELNDRSMGLRERGSFLSIGA